MFIFSIIELSAVPIVMIIVCAVLFKQSKSQTKTYGFRSLVPATIAIGYALVNAFVICPSSFGGDSIKQEVPTIVVVSILSGVVVALSIANIIYCLVKNSNTIEQPSNKIQNRSGALFKSIHNKYGFTLEDYDDLSEDQWLTYQSLSDENKRKFVDSYLRNHPNYENLRWFLDIIRDSILEQGFNHANSSLPEYFEEKYNPFLTFVCNINIPIYREIAKTVKYFIDRREIDPNSDWIYREELYEGTEKEVIFKIKSLVYATNDSYQVNALKHITIEDLMDENGRILPYKAMIDILNDIEVTRAPHERKK